MKTILRKTGFTGTLESEISVPVTINYTVDSEGSLEVTGVVLADGGIIEGKLCWERIPRAEEARIYGEALSDAARIDRECGIRYAPYGFGPMPREAQALV